MNMTSSCCPCHLSLTSPSFYRSLADLLKNPELHPSLRRAIVMALDAAKAMTYLHAHMWARVKSIPGNEHGKWIQLLSYVADNCFVCC